MKKHERGQGLVEAALILALVAVVAMLVLKATGNNTSGVVSGVSDRVGKTQVIEYGGNMLYVQTGEVLAGDVNNDGKVTSKDRILLARYLAVMDGYEYVGLSHASDVNRDGVVDNEDLEILKNYLDGFPGYSDYFKKRW